MSEPGKPQRLGSLGSGQDRLRGRGRGRGTLRKFAPTVVPRRALGSTEPGNVKPAIPKLLEVVQRPEVEQKPLVRPKKHQEPVAPSKVTFVASDVKKSSFVPNERSLRTTSAVSYSSTPSGSPLHDNEMDLDDDNADGSVPFAPIELPIAFSEQIASQTGSDDIDDIKTEEPSLEAKPHRHVKDVFESGLRYGPTNSEYIFWQLPSRLPYRNADIKSKKDKPSNSKANPSKPKSSKGAESTTTGSKLPDGFLGKLLIYKSGKVVLRCGSVDLLVNSGTQYPYRQELMAINLGNATCNQLATVTHRVVCTPDLSSLDHDLADLNLMI